MNSPQPVSPKVYNSMEVCEQLNLITNLSSNITVVCLLEFQTP